MESKIFKAYDIRGRYPEEINEKAAFEIAAKLPRILGRKIVVAHDARLSSPALYKAVIRGIKNYELRIKNRKNNNKPIIHDSLFIIPIGMATTPMFYFLVNKLRADGGVMVTASHNPKEYNGLKIVGKYAQPISGKEILKLVK